jgi:hypothetical protein
MEKLQQIPHGPNTRLASFDVKDMYTNILTSTLPHILNLICTQHDMTTKFTRELTKLMGILLGQNYFSFHDTIHMQNQGLAMGAPTSSIFSELFLLYTEHTLLFDILIENHTLGYFRYVDDVLIVYGATLTNIHTVLNCFNNVTSPLQFTIEEEQQQKINFLDITIYRGTDHFTYGIYDKPTATDTIIPLTSCHPLEHIYSAI